MARIPGLLTVCASALLCTGIATASPFERYLSTNIERATPTSQVEDPAPDPCELALDLMTDMITNCGGTFLDDQIEPGQPIEVVVTEYAGDIDVEVNVDGNLELQGLLSCSGGVWSYNDGNITISFEYYSDGTDEFLLVSYDNTDIETAEQFTLDGGCSGPVAKKVCSCTGAKPSDGTSNHTCVWADCTTEGTVGCYQNGAGRTSNYCTTIFKY